MPPVQVKGNGSARPDVVSCFWCYSASTREVNVTPAARTFASTSDLTSVLRGQKLWEDDILELSNLLQYIIDEYFHEISLYDQWKQRRDSIYKEKLHKILEKLLIALNLVSQINTFEIALQKLSLEDRQIYRSFFHTAKETLARTDMDNIRKGQIIRDLAAQLDFNSEQLQEFEQTSLGRPIEQ